MFILGKEEGFVYYLIFLHLVLLLCAVTDMVPLIYTGMSFLWKPVAILAAFMTGVSIAFLNDR
jgi:hypothetical protein